MVNVSSGRPSDNTRKNGGDDVRATYVKKMTLSASNAKEYSRENLILIFKTEYGEKTYDVSRHGAMHDRFFAAFTHANDERDFIRYNHPSIHAYYFPRDYKIEEMSEFN